MKRTFLNLKYMKIQLCDRKDEFLIFSHRLETIKYEKMMFKSLPKKIETVQLFCYQPSCSRLFQDISDRRF